MADEPDTVTVRREDTLEEREVAKGAEQFWTNSGWVVLDSAGRKKAQQPTTVPAKES